MQIAILSPKNFMEHFYGLFTIFSERDIRGIYKNVSHFSNAASPTHRPPLPPKEIFLVLISVRGRDDPGSEYG
jgi:hypothetical protein